MTTNQDIVEYAREQMGTLWVHQGRIPGQQLDCAGLIVCACQHFGLPFDDIKSYGRRPDGVTIKRILDEQTIPMDDGNFHEPGRIAVFWCRKATKAWQHLGITSGNGRMIHGHDRREHIIENMISGHWEKRFVASYRFKEVDYTWQP